MAEYPCDLATWRLIPKSTASAFVIWPDEEMARKVPPSARPELRIRAAEHVVRVLKMRQKLRDVKASRFTLAELAYLWGEYDAEEVETHNVIPLRDIHEAFEQRERARLRLAWT